MIAALIPLLMKGFAGKALVGKILKEVLGKKIIEKVFIPKLIDAITNKFFPKIIDKMFAWFEKQFK